MKKYFSIGFISFFVFLGLSVANNVKAVSEVPTYTATMSVAPEVAVPVTLHVDPTAGTGGLDFVLNSSDATSGWYFTNANAGGCTTTLSSNTIHMNAGTANKNFCYFDSTPGTYVLSATNSLSTTASQEITVAGGAADTTSPTLDITTPADNSLTNDNTVSSLNFDASDDTDEVLDYAIYVDDPSASGGPVSTGTISSGGGIGASIPAQTDGTHTITIKVTDDAGNYTIKSVTVNIDTVDPIILSAETSDPYNIVEVLFDEELQNNGEGHHPQISDFDVHNGEISYGVGGVSYENKKVTITLTNPIKLNNDPKLYVYPALNSLVDPSGNYFNNGNSYSMNIKINAKQNKISSGGWYVSPEEPTKIPDCGTRTSGFSTINGEACANNIPHEEGEVLGAETFQFTRNLVLGMEGDDVLELHKKLTTLGFYSGPIDNKFGLLLLSAVKEFQKANPPLVVDGIVGPLTRAALNK